MIIDVYEYVDADVLTSAIRFQFGFFSAPNPSEHRDSVVSQMIDVAEVENIGFTRIFTEFAVLFANDSVFVHESDEIQKGAYSGTENFDFERFLNETNDFSDRLTQILFYSEFKNTSRPAYERIRSNVVPPFFRPETSF